MLFLKEKHGLGENYVERGIEKVGWFSVGKGIDSAITQFGQRSIELIRHEGSLFQTIAISLSNICCFSFNQLLFLLQTSTISLSNLYSFPFETSAFSLPNIRRFSFKHPRNSVPKNSKLPKNPLCLSFTILPTRCPLFQRMTKKSSVRQILHCLFPLCLFKANRDSIFHFLVFFVLNPILLRASPSSSAAKPPQDRSSSGEHSALPDRAC